MRKTIINVLAIFLISCLLHFIYDWFPNFITSLLFPVNESIFEHNKIIIGSFLVWAIIKKLKFKNEQNYLFSNFLASIICAILVLLIFSPIYFYILKTNDNIFITFAIYLLCIYISEKIRVKYLIKDYEPKKEKLAILGFIIVIIINAFLTYYPPALGIFYDYTKNQYGLKN